MLEKLTLAAVITFSLNLFLAFNATTAIRTDSEMFLGKGQVTTTVSLLNR